MIKHSMFPDGTNLRVLTGFLAFCFCIVGLFVSGSLAFSFYIVGLFVSGYYAFFSFCIVGVGGTGGFFFVVSVIRPLILIRLVAGASLGGGALPPALLSGGAVRPGAGALALLGGGVLPPALLSCGAVRPGAGALTLLGGGALRLAARWLLALSHRSGEVERRRGGGKNNCRFGELNELNEF